MIFFAWSLSPKASASCPSLSIVSRFSIAKSYLIADIFELFDRIVAGMHLSRIFPNPRIVARISFENSSASLVSFTFSLTSSNALETIAIAKFKSIIIIKTEYSINNSIKAFDGLRKRIRLIQAKGFGLAMRHNQSLPKPMQIRILQMRPNLSKES
eukprot:UN27818